MKPQSLHSTDGHQGSPVAREVQRIRNPGAWETFAALEQEAVRNVESMC